MSEETKEKKVHPIHWPREWAKDEKFWKDVASRTASGVLVLVIAYLYSVTTGYLASPEVQQSGLDFVIRAGCAFLVTIGVGFLISAIRHRKRGQELKADLVYSLSMFLAAATVIVTIRPEWFGM